MPKAAYCSECAGYVWLGKDGGCANGHARSCLRELYDAQPNLETGKPLPQFNYPPLPVSPTMREAGAILGAGVASLAAAAGRRAQEAAARLAQPSPSPSPAEPAMEQYKAGSPPLVPTSEPSDPEPNPKMLGVVVAHVRTSNLSLRWVESRFWLDSVGELTPEEVRSRDHNNTLVWMDGARARFLATFPGPASVGPTVGSRAYGPLQPLTHAADGLLRIAIGVTALAIVAGLAALVLEVAIPRRGLILARLGELSGIIGYVQAGLWFVVAVSFLMWVYRLTANLRAFSGQTLEHTPGWAVGWFFVPVAGLFKPYEVLREAWQVSHGEEVTRLTLVGWWWFLYLASSLIGRIASTLATRSSEFGLSAASPTLAFIVSDLFTLAMYVAFLLLLSRISAAYSRNIREVGVQAHRISLSELGVRVARINRRHVLTVAGVLVLVALLFPPWVAYRAPTAGSAGSGGFFGGGRAPDPGYSVPIGWHLVFVGPPINQSSYAIDWSRLTIEVLLIAAATTLAAYTLPGARRQAVSVSSASSTL